MELKDVLSFKEASEEWGLENSTLRKAIPGNKNLIKGVDYRKSAGTWLIIRSAMIKVYGNFIKDYIIGLKTYLESTKIISIEELNNKQKELILKQLDDEGIIYATHTYYEDGRAVQVPEGCIYCDKYYLNEMAKLFEEDGISEELLEEQRKHVEEMINM